MRDISGGFIAMDKEIDIIGNFLCENFWLRYNKKRKINRHTHNNKGREVLCKSVRLGCQFSIHLYSIIAGKLIGNSLRYFPLKVAAVVRAALGNLEKRERDS